MAQNPLTQFITDRFIAPAVQAHLPAVQKDTSAFAVGVNPQPNLSLRDTLGQAPDTDYDLLYAIYQDHQEREAFSLEVLFLGMQRASENKCQGQAGSEDGVVPWVTLVSWGAIVGGCESSGIRHGVGEEMLACPLLP